MRIREHARRSLLLGTAAVSLAGCLFGPTNGQVYDGDGGTTQQQTVGFSGFYITQNQTIHVQVLKAPELDPTVNGNWTDVPGSPVKTGTTPYTYNDPTTPMYLWQLDSKPASVVTAAWPSGGLLRVRARATDGTGKVINDAVVFDDDFASCRSEHASESWEDIMTACKSPYGSGNVAALVSSRTKPSDTLAQAASSPYLSQPLGAGESPATGATYYAVNFDVANYPTLDKFKSFFGFTADSFAPIKGTAIYYNAGDLGLGREMHCRLTVDLTKVCFVTNYADRAANGKDRIFGGAQVHVDSALAKAIKGFKGQSGSDPVATVAMVQHLNAPILFLVYGADGSLSPNATLDASANPNTEVPKNCITCHAGAGGFDGANVSGAHFLLFDLDSFQYSGTAGFTESDQLTQLRALNDIAAWNDSATGIASLHDGWYPDSTSTFHGDFRPAAWNNGATGANKVYDGVIKKYCRTCHSAQTASIARPDFTTPAQLNAATVQAQVCDSHLMPQALLTQNNFWNSPARAHLTGFLGLKTACKP